MLMKNEQYISNLKTNFVYRNGQLLRNGLHGACCKAIQTLMRRPPFASKGYFMPGEPDTELRCGNKTCAISGARKEV